MPIPLMRTCRDASLLISERQDRALTWRERLELGIHLRICVACPHFENQIDLLGRAMGRWRSDDAPRDDNALEPVRPPARR